LLRASHRWYGLGGELLYEELLWSAPPQVEPLAPLAALRQPQLPGVLGTATPPVLKPC
jgi:hypothetical protein